MTDEDINEDFFKYGVKYHDVFYCHTEPYLEFEDITDHKKIIKKDILYYREHTYPCFAETWRDVTYPERFPYIKK